MFPQHWSQFPIVSHRILSWFQNGLLLSFSMWFCPAVTWREKRNGNARAIKRRFCHERLWFFLQRTHRSWCFQNPDRVFQISKIKAFSPFKFESFWNPSLHFWDFRIYFPTDSFLGDCWSGRLCKVKWNINQTNKRQLKKNSSYIHIHWFRNQTFRIKSSLQNTRVYVLQSETRAFQINFPNQISVQQIDAKAAWYFGFQRRDATPSVFACRLHLFASEQKQPCRSHTKGVNAVLNGLQDTVGKICLKHICLFGEISVSPDLENEQPHNHANTFGHQTTFWENTGKDPTTNETHPTDDAFRKHAAVICPPGNEWFLWTNVHNRTDTNLLGTWQWIKSGNVDSYLPGVYPGDIDNDWEGGEVLSFWSVTKTEAKFFQPDKKIFSPHRGALFLKLHESRGHRERPIHVSSAGF